MSLKEREIATATNEIICTCFITGIPSAKNLWGRLKDIFDPDPQLFSATIRARASKDPDFSWVTTVEDVNGASISATMTLNKLLEKQK